jgi:hypothetical protein
MHVNMNDDCLLVSPAAIKSSVCNIQLTGTDLKTKGHKKCWAISLTEAPGLIPELFRGGLGDF